MSTSSLLSLVFILSVVCHLATAAQPHPEQPHANYKDYQSGGGVGGGGQYTQANSAAQADAFTLGTRQGSLIGHPLGMFLPVILLVGLGALILIPMLFLFMSPMAGFAGAGGYGRKRSITEDFMRKNLMDLVGQVSEAVEKYGGPFLDKVTNSKPSKP